MHLSQNYRDENRISSLAQPAHLFQWREGAPITAMQPDGMNGVN
jgi:hypothetical protein